jgi:hypothetical protein
VPKQSVEREDFVTLKENQAVRRQILEQVNFVTLEEAQVVRRPSRLFNEAKRSKKQGLRRVHFVTLDENHWSKDKARSESIS